jgi:phospholipid transport system substrate-binding protein
MFIAAALRSLVLTLSLGLCLGRFAHAAPVDDAKTALLAGVEEVAAELRKSPEQENLISLLGPMVDKHFALATTTRLAVGPTWRDLTTTQRTEATQLFSRLVIRTYAARYNGDTQPEITYGTPLELKSGRVEVPSTVKSKGKTYSVAYRMELDAVSQPNRWRVYDVVAEGVSLISNYRSQFDAIIKQSGPEGFLGALRDKLAEPLPQARTQS